MLCITLEFGVVVRDVWTKSSQVLQIGMHVLRQMNLFRMLPKPHRVCNVCNGTNFEITPVLLCTSFAKWLCFPCTEHCFFVKKRYSKHVSVGYFSLAKTLYYYKYSAVIVEKNWTLAQEWNRQYSYFWLAFISLVMWIFLHKIRQINSLLNFLQSFFPLCCCAMLSFPPREVYVKPPQITLIFASSPRGRRVVHLISPLGAKGLKMWISINQHRAHSISD